MRFPNEKVSSKGCGHRQQVFGRSCSCRAVPEFPGQVIGKRGITFGVRHEETLGVGVVNGCLPPRNLLCFS